MQRKLFKITLIIFITLLFLLKVSVRATSDATLDDLIVGADTAGPTTDPEVREEDELGPAAYATDEEEVDNLGPAAYEVDDEDELGPAVGSTATDNETNDTPSSESRTTNATSTYTPPSTVQPTQSYSTVATIPEANLSLNNILNVILIAVGVILILLAIAILIRLR